MLKVGILIFDEVEVLDFTGPLETLSCVKDVEPNAEIEVYTLGFEEGPVYCRSNLVVVPNFTLSFNPGINVLIIPGGLGARKVLADKGMLRKIKNLADSCTWICSVCTGSLILAEMGLLKGLKATTHHTCFNDLERISPETEIIKNQRFIEQGNIITSGGISAGIDMAFHLVEKFFGPETADKVAKEMEYRRP